MRDVALLGTAWPVFIGLTVICFGGCAVMMGRALAESWRPARHAIPYALLLGIADRFLVYALFDGDPLSAGGFIVDEYVILISALIAYRATLAAQMARQYPWLYERILVFGWRRKH